MAVFSVIQKSQLEGAKRLDAEYYQPKYLDASSKLKNLKTITLGEFCKVTDGDHAKIPGFVDSDGVRYLRAKDLQGSFIDDSDPVFVSKKYFEKLKRSHIKPGDIILSIMGTLGNIAVLTEEYGIVTANRAVSIISPKKDIFSPYFLIAFLESRFGAAQRERESMGGVQQRVNLDDLSHICVPIMPYEKQKPVIQIFKEALESHGKSRALYSQVERLLLDELGLADFEADGELWSVVKLSEARAAGRIDAEYFQSKYEKLEARLEKGQSKKLSEIIQVVPAKFELESDKTYRYVELADVNASLGVINACTEVLGKEAPSRARRLLKAGDVIVSSVQGSLGKVALVSREYAGTVASTGFFQFRSKEILPEVLLVLAKSIVLQSQLEQRCAGTILTAVPKESIKNILVPILSGKTQQKVAELVRQSHEARAKAKRLLEDAKRKVEELIESKSTYT